jgi:3-oxoacyl-[acyl-carrier-protein] synthase-1
MSLAITGAGMVTSLGYGVSGSCAAIRAGLAMPRQLDIDVDDGPGQVAPARGHPVWPLTDGFFQTGAWLRLALAAFDDLVHVAKLPAGTSREFWKRTLLSGALPVVHSQRFRWSLAEQPNAPEECFLRPLVELAAPGIASPWYWNALGHVSTAAALLRAEQELRARGAERLVVSAVDSYVDTFTLSWLHQANRLKSGGCSTGFLPGEAGAALLVESTQAARLRKARILGTIEAVAVGKTPRLQATRERAAASDRDEEPFEVPATAQLGRAVANVVHRVLPRAHPEDRFACDLYLDLNGEAWRAAAWGQAQVLLSRALDLDRCRTFFPADSLGETGAASVPIATALALQTFGKDRTEQALVISVSDDGRVSAIRLRGSSATEA